MFRNSFYIIKHIFKIKPFLIPIRILLTTFDSIAMILNLMLPKWIIDGILNSNMNKIIFYLILIFSFNIFCSILNRLTSLVITKNTEELNIKLTDEFLKKTIKIPIRYYYEESFFNDYSFCFNNVCDVHLNVMNCLIDSYSTVLNLALTTSVIIKLDVYFYLIIALSVVISTIIKIKSNNLTLLRENNLIKNNRKLDYIYNLFIYPRYLRDMKIISYQNFIFDKKDKYSKNYINQYINDTSKLLNLDLLSSIKINVENFIIIIYFTYLMIKRKIFIDDYFIYIEAYNRLKSEILKVINIYTSLKINSLYINKYFNLFNNYKIDDRKCLNSITSISIENLKYSYDKSRILFNVFNFTFNKGDRVLINGLNGVGKSTLIKLLLGMLIPTYGKIYFNNNKKINTYNYNPQNSFGIQFQDVNIYPFTIIENITLNSNYNKKEDIVYNNILFKDLKDRMNESVFGQFTNNGTDLSGGQIQIVGILRAIYNNSDVLIFDEPLNNLDKDKKEEVVNFINNLNNNIIIVISHDGCGFKYNKKIEL